MGPPHLFETEIAVQEMQPVSSWGGFISMLYPERSTEESMRINWQWKHFFACCVRFCCQ